MATSRWRRGITREISIEAKRTFRWINRSASGISSVEVLKDPSDVTVAQTVTGETVFLTLSNGKTDQKYEVGPKITFNDGDIDYFPVEFEFYED